jgi:hypothetical protein
MIRGAHQGEVCAPHDDGNRFSIPEKSSNVRVDVQSSPLSKSRSETTFRLCWGAAAPSIRAAQQGKWRLSRRSSCRPRTHHFSRTPRSVLQLQSSCSGEVRSWHSSGITGTWAYELAHQGSIVLVIARFIAGKRRLCHHHGKKSLQQPVAGHPSPPPTRGGRRIQINSGAYHLVLHRSSISTCSSFCRLRRDLASKPTSDHQADERHRQQRRRPEDREVHPELEIVCRRCDCPADHNRGLGRVKTYAGVTFHED